MLGSDKHHICLKGTNINDHTHLTTNELVMIEAYYQENIKV